MRLSTWRFFLISLTLTMALVDGVLLRESLSGLVQKLDAFIPLLSVIAIASLGRAFFPGEAPVALRVILALIGLGFNLRYLHWRFTQTLVLDWYNGPISIALVVMEAIAILNTTVIIYQTLWRTNHSPQADHLAEQIRQGNYQPSVDIFIPTYDEPETVLQRTLIGALNIRYPNKTIWLLDDGERPSAEKLCQELGCNYLTRTEHSHAKAGNLNNGLRASTGEIIVTFDADFVPLNYFLERALGFFMDPQVAMIVTPQNFYNPDPPEMNLGGRILPHEQTVFYGILQSGRDRSNSVICTGTSILFRRRCIEEMGGFPTNTIVEDWVTGMTLQAQGYRTLYLNEMLSVGAAPHDLGAYLVQRIRWAEGTLKTLFSPYSPHRVKGFNLIQRINHLSGILYWIDQATQSVAYVAPALYLLFGMRSLGTNIPDIISYWASTYFYGILVIAWITGCRTIVVSFTYNILQSFHLLPVVVKTLLFPHKRVKFKTTPKEAGEFKIDYVLLRPILVLLVLNLASLIATVIDLMTQATIGAGVINLFWAQFNILILILGLLASINVSDQQRSVPRIHCPEACLIQPLAAQPSALATPHDSIPSSPLKSQKTAKNSSLHRSSTPLSSPSSTPASARPFQVLQAIGDRLEGKILDISEKGVAFQLKRPTQKPSIKPPLFKPGQLLEFSIEPDGIVLLAQVQYVNQGRIGCRFIDMGRQQLFQLIEFIYCRPHRWPKPQVANEWEAFKAIAVSLWNCYPLQRMKGLG